VSAERYASILTLDNAIALIVMLANTIVDNPPPRPHNKDYSGRMKLACKGNTGHAY
jgi:hypothetical protein